jgi:hypothetical protein
MSIEILETAVGGEALLRLGVHDGLAIGALRGGEGGGRAPVKGRHWQSVWILHASRGKLDVVVLGIANGFARVVVTKFDRRRPCVFVVDYRSHGDWGFPQCS